MLSDLIKSRKIPALAPKDEMMSTLLAEEYGIPVPSPDSLDFSV